jgi:hypothetical protein
LIDDDEFDGNNDFFLTDWFEMESIVTLASNSENFWEGAWFRSSVGLDLNRRKLRGGMFEEIF